jgi:periplasmic protein TonB
MNFAQRQRDPRRHLVGFTAVVLFHVLLVYALLTGLAKKVVDVVRAPIETKVIEEIKKPPPPPEVVVPPPPKLEAPPPPYIPPPEVQIAAPPPPAPTITVAPSPTPPAPVTIAPMPPVVAAPAPPAPAPTTDVRAYCTNMPKPEVPGTSFSGKISLTARGTLKGGKIVQPEVVPGSFRGTSDRKVQRAFGQAVIEAMQSYTCAGDNIVVTQEFGFTIE